MEVHGSAKAAYLGLERALSNNRLADVKWFAEQEANTWSNWVDLPLGRRLWLYRHGFTSPCWLLYDFERYGPESYLSELGKYRFYRAVNGRHRYLLDDKLSQHWMMNDYPEHRPTAFGVIDDGYVHGVSGTALEGGSRPVAEWLPAALRRESALVLKGLRGMGGKQVRVVAYEDGYRLDDEPVSEAALCEAVGTLSGYLVTEYVDQHDYADELYAHSANTTIPAIGWDVIVDESGEPIVIEANTGTDVDLLQVHRPLLADRRVAEVVARHLSGVEQPVGEGRSAPEAEPVPVTR